MTANLAHSMITKKSLGLHPFLLQRYLEPSFASQSRSDTHQTPCHMVSPECSVFCFATLVFSEYPESLKYDE